MQARHCLSTFALLVFMASSAKAQIVSGVMIVTGAEMH